MNAIGIELLDRFNLSRLRKGTVGKDRRKLGGTSIRPETPNEPGVEVEDEVETSTRALLSELS